MAEADTFRELLQEAINIRENALYPDNLLFELPFDSKTEEIIKREQAIIRCILDQFNKTFPRVVV